MGTFVREMALFSGILGVITLPLVFVARANKREKTLRRFLVAATVIALVSALVSVNSEHLAQQCRDAGNTSCYDPGGRGMQAVAVFVYAMAAWAAAFFIYRD